MKLLPHNQAAKPPIDKGAGRARCFLLGPVLALTLAACGSSPPESTANLCHIFDDKRGWYRDAHRAARRWDGDIATMMAIMHQESSFVDDAKPPRGRFLFIFPGRRPSSAYGYAQAIDGTWDTYRRDSGRGRADRDDFDDAIDFIAWYNHRSRIRNGITPTDAHNLYLAYHEGHGNYNRGSHHGNDSLQTVATAVARQARRYRAQLERCEHRFRRGFWGRIF